MVAMVKKAMSWSIEYLKLIPCTLDQLYTPTITKAQRQK